MHPSVEATPPPAVPVGNDYRDVAALPAVATPTVTVVVPVYERTGLLDRTLAGLAAQTVTDGLDVVVVDDGSSEDVGAVVAAHEPGLDVRLLRQAHDGFGAGQARQLGVDAAGGDVVLFLDADCIPTPTLVERHRWWHARAGNLVVVGSRRAIDSSHLSAAAIAAGTAGLWDAVGVDEHERLVPPDDWRAPFHRATRRLLLGDEGFRTATTANLSVTRAALAEVGPFDPAFRLWGGEDTELAWRLWNDGLIVVPEDRALALHQVQLDGDTDRGAARRRTLPIVADRVPHRFYRATPSPLSLVPRLSWLVAVADEQQRRRAEHLVATALPADAELVLLGPAEVVGDLEAAAASNPRRHVVVDDGPAAATRALLATRGELVVVVAGATRVNADLVSVGVDALDADPRADAFRVAYRAAGDRWLRLDDLAAIDATTGRHGLPRFALVRRRELRKHHRATDDVGAAWAAIAAAHDRLALSLRDGVRLERGTDVEATLPGLAELRAADPAELVRGAVRVVRRARGEVERRARGQAKHGARGEVEPRGRGQVERRARGQAERRAATDDERAPSPIGVEYVGLTGKHNLGDDAVQLAVERLLPWAEVGVGLTDPRLLVVGGGTLLNGRRYYLNRMLRADSPAVARAMVGTGVRNPDYWGVTEPMEDWFSFLDAAVHASVRGPDSVRNLAALGYDGEVEVIGDPALSLVPRGGADRVDGRVVVSPVWTDGNCHGGDDAVVFDALAATIRRLRTAGREVVLLSCFPEDDRRLIGLMRAAGAPDLPYVAGYDDVDDSLDLLASADLVVGERLHAAILAASAGTPFVALEYRPKVLDFARSVDQEDAVVRTDEVERLDEVVDTVLAEAAARRAVVAAHVAEYRRRQQRVALLLHDVAGAGA